MSTTTSRLQLPLPGPGDPFKPASVDFPALGNRLDAVAARQPGDAVVALPVLDVGAVGQLRAGRVLQTSDFTSMGLAAPVSLWSLSAMTNKGVGGTLTNKGAVPLGVGITGAASEAAVFSGSTAQVLYVADSGAGDPHRILTGTVGCWFRTAKRDREQVALSKWGAAGSRSWSLGMFSSAAAGQVPVAEFQWTTDGTTVLTCLGSSDIGDDRWHYIAGSWDGQTARLYVDGVLEGQITSSAWAGGLHVNAAPVNIGGQSGDAATATASATVQYGRVDEAFITPDVLSDEQVRLLYCAKVAHSYAVTPTRAHLSIARMRRGATLAVADFPAQPVRLHNLGAAIGSGSAQDLGSGAVALTPSSGIVDAAGPDGVRGGATHLDGAAGTSWSATDAGLTSGTGSRSYGLWFKTSTAVGGTLMGWGTTGTADTRLTVTAAGIIGASNGASSIVPSTFVADGKWHHAVVVEDNSAGDGVKRKLYVDGKLVGGSTSLVAITLAGANRFRIGAAPDGTLPVAGSFARAFVYPGVLTGEQVRALYRKANQQLAGSPKSEGDHVEALDASNVLFTFDEIDGKDLVSLQVAA